MALCRYDFISRCASKSHCLSLFHLSSPKCVTATNNSVMAEDLTCSYCCSTDLCNSDMIPAIDSQLIVNTTSQSSMPTTVVTTTATTIANKTTTTASVKTQPSTTGVSTTRFKTTQPITEKSSTSPPSTTSAPTTTDKQTRPPTIKQPKPTQGISPLPYFIPKSYLNVLVITHSFQYTIMIRLVPFFKDHH